MYLKSRLLIVSLIFLTCFANNSFGFVFITDTLEVKDSTNKVFINDDIMSYFKKRLTQAPDDAQYVLDYALENAKTRQEQEDVCNALTFKTQVLWSMFDALHFSYYDPGIIPPGAFIPNEYLI